MVSFPRVFQEVIVLVRGSPEVSHSAVFPRSLHVPPLPVKGGCGPIGVGTAALL